jgi:hypothetical protein
VMHGPACCPRAGSLTTTPAMPVSVGSARQRDKPVPMLDDLG